MATREYIPTQPDNADPEQSATTRKLLKPAEIEALNEWNNQLVAVREKLAKAIVAAGVNNASIATAWEEYYTEFSLIDATGLETRDRIFGIGSSQKQNGEK